MTDAELTHLEALASAVTPGEWKLFLSLDTRPHTAMFRPGVDCTTHHYGWKTEEPFHTEQTSNAKFIAASRTAIPQLIAEVRRLRGVLRHVTVLGYERGQTINLESCSRRLEEAVTVARAALGEKP